MAMLLNKRIVKVSTDKLHQRDIYAIVLEKMLAAINTEIEKPNGQFTANDLGRLQKEMYG